MKKPNKWRRFDKLTLGEQEEVREHLNEYKKNFLKNVFKFNKRTFIYKGAK